MKKKSKALRVLAICLAAVLLLIAGSIGYMVVKFKTNSLSTLFAVKPASTAAAPLGSGSKSLLDQQLAILNAPDEDSSASPAPQASPAVAPSATNGDDVIDLLILGVDSRDYQIDSQTDSILLVRVDKTKNTIKIASISRDIYLSIPGYTDYTVNEACVYGGPELVMQTLNETFGLNIQHYIVFDFKTAEQMIDMIGKVTVTVDQDELGGLNSKIEELNQLSKDGPKAPPIAHTGKQELNGRQAVAYARLRPGQGSDIVRTGRQREVLLSLIQQVKGLKPDQVLSLADKAMEVFYTNLPVTQIPSMALDLYHARGGSVQQFIVPVEGSYKEMAIVQMKFLVIDFKENSDALQKFLND